MQSKLSQYKEEMQSEISENKKEMQFKISEYKEEMQYEISEFKKEMHSDMSEFKKEMQSELSEFKKERQCEISKYKEEMNFEIFEYKKELREEIQFMECKIQRMEIEFTSKLSKKFGKMKMVSHSSPDTDGINAKTFTQVLKDDASFISGNGHPRTPKVSSLDVSHLNHLYNIFRTFYLIQKKFFFSPVSVN